jgi:nitrite reductase (NADH) large subunit
LLPRGDLLCRPVSGESEEERRPFPTDSRSLLYVERKSLLSQVIIGNGISGITAALTLRKKNLKDKITVIAEEVFLPYARMILPDYIAGLVHEEALFPFDPVLFASIKMILGKRVEEIRPDESAVILAGGKKIFFDNLLIASGASAQIPDIAGFRQEGVYPIRDLSHARKIRACAASGSRAVVLGGGLVGLEATGALVSCGMQVEMVVTSAQILSRVFDSRSAGIIEGFLEKKGVAIRKHSEAIGIDGRGKKKVVYLGTGEELVCDLVIVAKGVTPNVDFLPCCGLEKAQGILVNQRMQASLPHIYAAGDVASAPGFFEEAPIYNAIWGEAIFQGRVAGGNMAGGNHVYEGNLRANIFEILGLKASAIGKGSGPVSEKGTFYRDEYGAYKKLVFENGRLVGALLVGKIEEAGVLQHLIRRKIDLSGAEEFYLQNRISFGRLLPI